MDIIWTARETTVVVFVTLLLIVWYVDERWLAPRRAHNRAVAARRQARLTQTRNTNVRIVTAEPCRSGHTDCTVDCGWCKGTGYMLRPAGR